MRAWERCGRRGWATRQDAGDKAGDDAGDRASKAGNDSGDEAGAGELTKREGVELVASSSNSELEDPAAAMRKTRLDN